MTEISVHDFQRETDCVYDEERYSVRDNGAVLRHSRMGKRLRKDDNQWVFGKPNSQNGYMYLSQVRIHRIVATAFHADPPTLEHVVDHIDTNRRNNRPENLRWLTRLENALLNPVTVKRIEFLCGSIEAFLEDPSKLRHSSFDRSFEWMRTVTTEEAHACRERMHLWAKSDRPSAGGGSLGEWLFKPIPSEKVTAPFPRQPFRPTIPESEPNLVASKTLGAVQRKWRTPSEFPCCPQEADENPLAAYLERLSAGSIFACNQFSKSVVLDAAIADEGKSIWVMCENAETGAIKPWSLAQVTHENEVFVHTSHGTFFEKAGAEKRFCLARGLEWIGGDTFDDYC